MLYVVIFVIVSLTVIGYLAALRPNTERRDALVPFCRTYIAHRGLYNTADIPENSISAFADAVGAGYGIELDVQLTADHQLVVFHDRTLRRMCGDDRTVQSLAYEELRTLSLLDTGERIPLLSEVLALVHGAVPLIVEIKPRGNWRLASALTDQQLRCYEGNVGIQAFHPLVLRWFRTHSPRIPRGLLSPSPSRVCRTLPGSLLFTNLLCNFLAAPDFISYDHKRRKDVAFRLCRRLYDPVNAAWTLRSQEELDAAVDMFGILIFDGFLPEEKPSGPEQ